MIKKCWWLCIKIRFKTLFPLQVTLHNPTSSTAQCRAHQSPWTNTSLMFSASFVNNLTYFGNPVHRCDNLLFMTIRSLSAAAPNQTELSRISRFRCHKAGAQNWAQYMDVLDIMAIRLFLHTLLIMSGHLLNVFNWNSGHILRTI